MCIMSFERQKKTEEYNKPPGYVFENLKKLNEHLVKELFQTLEERRRCYEQEMLMKNKIDDIEKMRGFWESKKDEILKLEFHKIHDSYSRQDRENVIKEEYAETIRERNYYKLKRREMAVNCEVRDWDIFDILYGAASG